jgi:hypothetical protein
LRYSYSSCCGKFDGKRGNFLSWTRLLHLQTTLRG